ncbi:hypothetical protein M0R45_000399 [Rubus argutus]|uniref:hAT-like transposase RNase-H fold domain-containing protein n=1 Tax=Rubus argutus TaxID=59490 RepID=A0AAW1VMV7_RUBAR
MKKKIDKYWLNLKDMNKILLFAVVLDPRYKLLYLDFFFPKLQKDKELLARMVKEVNKIFLKLYHEYNEVDPLATQPSIDVTRPKVDNLVEIDEEVSQAANMKQFMMLRKEKDVFEIRDEVDKYLLEASEDPTNPKFNVSD